MKQIVAILFRYHLWL